MKSLLTVLFLLFANILSAQVISYEDFKTIIPFLEKEDYKGAFAQTGKLLSSTQNNSSDLRGIVTYMNIFSAAGMVAQDEMSFEDFSKNANKYVGQWIVMAAHPCVDSGVTKSNSLKFISRNGIVEGMTTATNMEGTNIFCFEYFNYAQALNPVDFIGKEVRCGGILKAVEVNPNKSKIWISRLRISNAFARASGER